MLVSLNWLKQYVNTGTLSVEELAEKITKAGIEVDGIHPIAENIENVVVGYVESCEQHPNADKLNLCQVDVGEEKLQIICGAPNISAGQKVAVAKPGAVLPGNFKIKKVKLRGIESNGMICSLQELGMQDDYIPDDVAEGIFVFPSDVEIGEDVTPLLNLDDVILEFDLTPNRADALSMIGVAYEVAAILDVDIKLPEETVERSEEQATDYIAVQVTDKTLAPYYGAFMIKDAEIKPSPLWMRNYLMASGIRPINNVVDITNYVLLEYGQPLHAFDYEQLKSKEIVVRPAEENETIVTLDDKERKLHTSHLVITNGREPVALAGVMGGANTEVTDQTTNILLEAAYFNPQSVRKTVQDTGLRSEASNRFEKGVDPNRVKKAGLRACQLLQKYANAKVLSGEAVYDALEVKEKSITIKTVDINKRLGTKITDNEIGSILKKLRFEYEASEGSFVVKIPTRRGDIAIFEDMLEEIARIYGYDHIPTTLPASASTPGALTERQRMKREMKYFLEGVGLSEARTYSLTKEKDAKVLVSPDLKVQTLHPIKLNMPISEDHNTLRLSILPELLKSVAYNRARSQKDLAFYEIGSVFLTEEEKLTKQPFEQLRLAGVLMGMWKEQKWQGDHKKVDFYVIKGIVEGLFHFLNIHVTFQRATLDHMHPGRCAIISLNKQPIGFIGQIHPSYASELDLDETYVFDINMDTVLDHAKATEQYTQVPKYPSIMRDVAFIVEDHVLAGDIQATIEESGKPLVKKVELFDVYKGDNVATNQKSLAFSLHFQDPKKTLKDKEVEEVFQEVVSVVSQKFDASIRSE